MNHIEIIDSLNRLNPNQDPLWGKMTTQHMVEHLYKTVQSSISEISLGLYTEERKIPVLKKLFFGKRPFPKEFMNPAVGPDLLKLEFHDLRSAVKEFENLLHRYELFFTHNPSIKTIHPIFGYLDKDEWDVFHTKHFKHHLSQFGLSD